MAKVSTKAPAEKKAPAKKAPAKAKAVSIEKVSEDIISKLKALNLEQQLQADIEWCLGSYRYDQNPIGLFENAAKALVVFKHEQARKTKGVTAAFISSIEKALS